MKKRILSCLMALALCLTLLPAAALAAEPEGTAQTPPAVEESTDPANGEAKQENQPAAPEQEGQSAEQEEQQEDSASKQDEAVAAVQAMIDALPDAEALDGMDDADAMAVYEAFQTACDAYYETLTEGQQAQLKNTEKLEALSAWFSQPKTLAAGGHQHPICGASCTDDENHDNVTWRGASNVTGLEAGGHYYLIRDVKVSETWHPADGVVLCLNGHSITATTTSINVIEVDKGKTFTLTDCGTAGTVTHEAEKRGRGVMVFGTFNLYGGNITGNQTDGNYNDRGTFGAGVYVATYSVFNMYGGKITGNMGYSGGGSVYVAPTYADSSRAVFNMSGGEISGNSSLLGDSSGVYVNGGEFIMSGGSITSNAGYGVDLCAYKNNVGDTYSGAFTVSGKVNITGNYKNVYNNGTLVGTLDYNVFLATGETITIGGTLNPESRIGITTQGEASADIATGGVGEDYDKIFSSDVKDKGYSFTKKDDGTLRFNGHDHNWQFTATTEMIKAKCTAPNCPVTASGSDEYNGGFVRLKVENTTYGDRWNNASVEASKQPAWRGPKASTIKIDYRNSETGEDLGTTAPTLPGSYTASITVEGLTVTRGFKITKATPTIRSWGGYITSNKYTGSPVPVPSKDQLTIQVNYKTVDLYDAITGYNWYKATKDNSGKYTKGEALGGAPTNAGDYYVEAVFKETDTTKAATVGTGFTIAPMDPQVVTAPAYNVYLNRAAEYKINLYNYLNTLTLGSNVTFELQTDLQNFFISAPSTVSTDGELSISMNAVNPSGFTNPAGTVQIWVRSSNYQWITLNVPIHLIAKLEQPLEVTMDGWTFGEAAKELQVNGLPTGVELTDPAVTVTYTNTKDGTTSSKRPTDAGSYTVTVSYETDTVIHTGTAEFTVSKREIAVPTADSRQFEYTGQEQTYVLGNFADAAYYTVSGAMTRTDAGSQNVTVQLKDKNNTVWEGGTDADKTYVFTIAPKPLSKVTIGDFFDRTYTGLPIRPAVVPVDGNTALTENTDYTVSYGANTNSVTKTYGDEDFTLATTGEVEGSTVTYESSEPEVATVDGTGKVTIKGVGTAVITAKASATEDYDEAAATCTLTVEKKPIAIPAADATVFTYNGTEQTYALAEDGAYTITGNKQTNANEMGYSVTAALKDTANTQWADGTAADKTYTFVIGKAVITVKAKDQSAYVGDKVPALSEDSYTVSGLVGEEKLTTQPTVKYVGADGKEITPDMTKTGEVKIFAGGAAASDNYTIRYEDGKLTVSTRPSGGGGSSRPSTHPVQAEVSKDPDGSVSLSKTSAAKGDKVTITVKPDRHYEVDEVIVRDSKGKQLAVKDNGDGTYTFEMPADKVTVEPTFTWVNPFADVANSAYYVDAVEWMLKREVTQGTTETTFSPNLNCTRAQIVTFLWRAAGSPEPKGTVSFADVSAGSYYAKAVAWAVENGITGGTGNGLFSPDAACTRAQSAAFLYRAAGSPAVSGSAGFSDVAANAYYAQAVAWAKEHGITDGIGGGLFGSANDCTRAQIAAFLWRLYAEK